MRIETKITTKKSVLFDDIILLKGEGNYTTFLMVNGEKYTVAKTIKKLENKYENRAIFFRSHKSYLINLHHIIDIDDDKLTMTNNLLALISRRRKSGLNLKIKQFNK